MILRNIEKKRRRYVGFTVKLKNRLQKHDEGGSKHTAKYTPWRLIMFFAFADEKKALAFKKYLKSGSGRVFAQKRFW